MSNHRDFLIRSSEKVIGHYRFMLETAATNEERRRFQDRIEQEQRVLAALSGGSEQQTAQLPKQAA